MVMCVFEPSPLSPMICGEKFRKVKLTEPLGMVDKSIRIESGNKKLIESNLGYDLSQTLDEIRPTYRFNESCQDTVPQAIIAFLERTDFEDAIRNAISLGGDSDTLAAITGSIAEAAYGVLDWIKDRALGYLDEPLRGVYDRWEAYIEQK